MSTHYFSSITLPRFDPRDYQPVNYSTINSTINSTTNSLIFTFEKKQPKSLVYKPDVDNKVVGHRTAYIYPKAVYLITLLTGDFHFTTRIIQNTLYGPTWTHKINNVIYKFHLPPTFVDYFTYKYISIEVITYITKLPKDIINLIAQYFPAPKYDADRFMYYFRHVESNVCCY
jgi:hypothetical protein